jgi:hypothetical protein
MKTLILALFAILFFALNGFAQLEASAYTTKHDGVKFDAAYYGTIKLKSVEKFRLAYAGIYESEIPKFMGGVMYLPTETVKISALAGVEKTHHFWGYRLGGIFLYEKEHKFLLELMIEKGNGNENIWARNTIYAYLTKKWYAGARQWSEHGIGPIVGYQFSTQGSLYVMPSHQFQSAHKHTQAENRFVVGITFDFTKKKHK